MKTNILILSRKGFILSILVGSIATLLPVTVKAETLTLQDFQKELIRYNRWMLAVASIVRPSSIDDDQSPEIRISSVEFKEYDRFRIQGDAWHKRNLDMANKLNLKGMDFLIENGQAYIKVRNEFRNGFEKREPEQRATLARLYYIDNVDNQPENAEEKLAIAKPFGCVEYEFEPTMPVSEQLKFYEHDYLVYVDAAELAREKV